MFYVLDLYVGIGWGFVKGALPFSSFDITFSIKQIKLRPAITLNDRITLWVLAPGYLQLDDHQIIGIRRNVEDVMAYSDDLSICFRTFNFAVFWLVEFRWVDGLSRAVDPEDLLSELGSFGEAKAVVPVDCEAFCWVIYPILNFLIIQIGPQPCPNNMLPFLIDPSLIIKLAIFSSSLQLILSSDLLQSLFLNNLGNFLSGS